MSVSSSSPSLPPLSLLLCECSSSRVAQDMVAKAGNAAGERERKKRGVGEIASPFSSSLPPPPPSPYFLTQFLPSSSFPPSSSIISTFYPPFSTRHSPCVASHPPPSVPLHLLLSPLSSLVFFFFSSDRSAVSEGAGPLRDFLTSPPF